jgi:hypothetical protein
LQELRRRDLAKSGVEISTQVKIGQRSRRMDGTQTRGGLYRMKLLHTALLIAGFNAINYYLYGNLFTFFQDIVILYILEISKEMGYISKGTEALCNVALILIKPPKNDK